MLVPSGGLPDLSWVTLVQGELSVGLRLGPYEVVRPLGKGGMGAVYLARDLRLGRLVALKVVGGVLAGTHAGAAQLMTEARATASLAHPNVVTLYDVGVADGLVYVALEYVDGRTLASRLREGTIPHAEGIRILRGLARGLAAAHAQGIVHRDLKPANVLLGADGRPRILDFGIALISHAPDFDDDAVGLPQAASGGEHEMEFLGTPRYMAPEQFSGAAGAPADVWAMGLLTYLVLTGRDAFAHRDPAEHVLFLTSATPLSLDLEDVPVGLRELLQRCLNKLPSLRPTAAEVDHFLADQDPLHLRPDDVTSPFPGLKPLGENDADLFGGRDNAVDACTERLLTGGLVVVAGATGVGKSSLVVAGILPRLRAIADTTVIHIRVGQHPLHALAEHLVFETPSTDPDATLVDRDAYVPPADVPNDVERLAGELATHPERAAAILLSRARATRRQLVVFVDQLEELVTATVETAQARAFLSALLTSGSEQEPVKIIVTVRDDYLGRVPWGSHTARVLLSTIFVDAPTADELCDMVARPLARLGYRLEDPAVATRLAQDLVGMPHAMPLLQIALRRLWATRDQQRRLIPRSTIDALGDVAQLISAVADHAVDALVAADLDVARELLLRLVSGERVRRRVAFTVLLAELGPSLPAVLARFLDAGVVVRDSNGWVELAHEAVIDTWPRLARWLDQTDVASTQAKELDQLAQRWLRDGRPDEQLLRRRSLEALETLEGDRLSAEARELLTRSRQARARERRGRAIVLSSIVGLAGLAFVAALVSAWALNERASTEVAARLTAERDRARLLAANATNRYASGDYLGAMAFARASLEAGDDLRARALVDAIDSSLVRFRLPRSTVSYGVALDESAGVAYVASQAKVLLRLDLQSGQFTELSGHGDQVTAVCLLPSGDVVSTDWSGELRVWSGRRSRLVARLAGTVPTSLEALDRDTVVVGQARGPATLVRVGDGLVTRVEASPATSRAMDLAADGTLWVGSAAGQAVALEGPAWERAIERRQIDEPIRAIRSTPGGLVAVGTLKGAVIVWRKGESTPLWRWEIGGDCRAVDWLDEHRVVAGCSAVLNVLDVRTGQRITHPIDGQPLINLAIGREVSVSISSKGISILSTARLLVADHVQAPLGPVTATGLSVKHDLAFASTSSGLHALRLSTGMPLRFAPLGGESRGLLVQDDALVVSHGPLVSKLALPDLRETAVYSVGSVTIDGLALSGDRLVAGTRDGRLVEWSLASGIVQRVTTIGGSVRELVLAEDGTWLALTGETIVVGNDTGISTRHDTGSELLSLSVDHDGIAYVGGSDGTIWRLGQHGGQPKVHRHTAVRKYAFGTLPDGRLAAAGADGRVAIFGNDEPTLLSGHRGDVNALTVSPSGSLLVAGGDDSTLRAWNLATGEAAWGHSRMIEEEADDARCRLADGVVEVTSTRASTQKLVERDTVRLVALPWGCAVLSATGQLYLRNVDGTLLTNRFERVSAIARSGNELLVAGDDAILSVDSDLQRQVLRAAPGRTERILVTGGTVWLGLDDGRVLTLDGTRKLPERERTPVTFLGEGPPATLLVGFADGTAELWETEGLERLRSERVHGAVVGAVYSDGAITILSELSDRLVFEVAALTGGRCAALRWLWQRTSLVWRDGAIVVEPPPIDHVCANEASPP